jgi:hypothetical protein
MLWDNMSSSGELNNLAVTRAVLQFRNIPDRKTGLSPAYMLLGRQLKDFLPSRTNQLPAIGSHKDLSTTWQEVAGWRELALAKRSAMHPENLSGQVKEHAPLNLGDHLMIQHQAGNIPRRWDICGVVVAVLLNRQYQVRMDGSRRITLRNRKFLRKITPIPEDPKDQLDRVPDSQPVQSQPLSQPEQVLCRLQ